MVYFGRLKGMERRTAKQWSLEYLDRVELADKATTGWTSSPAGSSRRSSSA